jgi:hypothetical protein
MFQIMITFGTKFRFEETQYFPVTLKVFIKIMNKKNKLEILRREYFHKLLTDGSVEDKMLLYIRAKKIFDLGKRKEVEAVK